MSWEAYFFADGMDKRAADIERRKTWAAIQYGGLNDSEKEAGLSFSDFLAGTAGGVKKEPLSDLKPRTVKSGQFFLHKEGRFSVIAKDKESGRLRWVDLTAPNSGFITEDVGGEDIGKALDLDGNWMKVADSKEEFIKLQMENRLGTNDAAKAFWSTKK